MNTTSMTLPHQTEPWAWPVAGAMAVPAAAQRRWLAVQEGRVWLTRSHRDATEPGMSDDIWLEAGQRHALPPGSEWVIEGWPQAQVALLQAPPQPAAAAGQWRLAWRKGWLQWPGRPQACGA